MTLYPTGRCINWTWPFRLHDRSHDSSATRQHTNACPVTHQVLWRDFQVLGDITIPHRWVQYCNEICIVRSTCIQYGRIICVIFVLGRSFVHRHCVFHRDSSCSARTGPVGTLPCRSGARRALVARVLASQSRRYWIFVAGRLFVQQNPSMWWKIFQVGTAAAVKAMHENMQDTLKKANTIVRM